MKLLSFITLLFTSFNCLFSQTATNLSQADTVKHFTIDNCVNEFDEAKIDSIKVGYVYWFVDKNFIDGRTLKLSVIEPHAASHPPHKHSNDEFFFILEGEAEFYLNGETKRAKPYASFYCPSDIEHGIKNVGDGELKYLVIKKYPVGE